ncbi:glycosyltransferase family 2 protein [Caldifermentibacillus hisashii]|uniref:glycosyltransferase n=1 Tax=Caldifermentibacillus hisashii TaxID=996558 RepID=UPI0034D45BB1
MLGLILCILILPIGILSGMILFKKNTIPYSENSNAKHGKISVIIPARNEEKNLPRLLDSLFNQSVQPDEIIVVDDHSQDQTKHIAEEYGVTTFTAPPLPAGWTGKNWAVWNGYLRSSGHILLFLDADIQLAENAIQSLISAQKRQSGVLSVVPYHKAEKFYEKFAMVLNILGVFSFTSPFEKNNLQKGLYGACIVTTRDDYEIVGGHQMIRSEMLDDLNLGALFQNARIKVSNYIGTDLVSFRMYPNGMKSELEGFAKGAILSTSSLHPLTLFSIILWIIGLVSSQFCFLFFGSKYFIPLLIGYICYVIQILYINQYIGSFGVVHPCFHFLSLLFFLAVVVYSLYQSVFRKKVIWKGRYIQVGKGDQS